jgi:hypothetical protein
MRKKAGRDDRQGRPHSERAGEALLGTGERAALYRALRDLPCSRCAVVIRRGDLFTRRAEKADGLLLVKCCRACVPFKSGGGLLDALFVAEGGGEAAPAADRAEVLEKVLPRLGPALAASRERRESPDSKAKPD